MANTTQSLCDTIAKSLGWCEGTPEYAGIRRRIYFVPDSDIVSRPTLAVDALGRPTTADLTGSFQLKADKKWYYIDILPDKSQLTSEPQGEYPSQTQLNKLVAVHPGVGPEATAAAAFINNTSCTFVVEDMKGRARVLGNDMYKTKGTVSQDNGQGAAGTAATTINVESTDRVPAPFYHGTLDTEDGEISYAAAA